MVQYPDVKKICKESSFKIQETGHKFQVFGSLILEKAKLEGIQKSQQRIPISFGKGLEFLFGNLGLTSMP